MSSKNEIKNEKRSESIDAGVAVLGKILGGKSKGKWDLRIRVLRRSKDDFCPIVAAAYDAFPTKARQGWFSNGNFIQAGRLLGISSFASQEIAAAADGHGHVGIRKRLLTILGLKEKK